METRYEGENTILNTSRNSMLLTEKPIRLETRDFNMISLGPGTGAGNCSHKKSRLASSWELCEDLFFLGSSVTDGD